jgi:uncharacterized iron-regulated membrane protein
VTARLTSWFWWHSALGALFGLLMFVVCWTGTIATLAYELDWLLNPALRVAPSKSTADWRALEDAARAAVPRGDVLSLHAPRWPGHAAEIRMVLREGVVARVFVDPYNAAVTGVGPMFSVQRFFRSLHANFFSLAGWGRYVVSFTGVVLIALLVTALVFWKRWWRRFAEFKPARAPVGALSPLHKLAGLWSLWFVLLIGATGVWYLYDIARFHVFDRPAAEGAPTSPAPESTNGAATERAEFPDGAKLVALAAKARPDLKVTLVIYGGDRPDRVEGWATGDVLARTHANQMLIDPRSARVASVRSVAGLSAYERVAEAIDPLHFGYFGGLPTQLLWFVFGLALSASALTGAVLMARSARARGGKARAAGRGARWIGTALAVAVLAVAGYEGWFESADYLRAPAHLGPSASAAPALAFVAGWTALTVAAVAAWAWELR